MYYIIQVSETGDTWIDVQRYTELRWAIAAYVTINPAIHPYARILDPKGNEVDASTIRGYVYGDPV